MYNTSQNGSIKVESFKIDHTKLQPGCYYQAGQFFKGAPVSQFIFDLRFIAPRGANPLTFRCLPSVNLHALEHLLAFTLRDTTACYNKANDTTFSILSVYPYGCLTGMGCIVTAPSNLKPQDVAQFFLPTLEVTLTTILSNLQDPEFQVPGNNLHMCGNPYSAAFLHTSLVNQLTTVITNYLKVLACQKASGIYTYPTSYYLDN